MHPKNELLRRLSEAKGVPLSGQDFADEFHISRTAVWKYIKEFEQDGYQIGTIRKKGYFLEAIPDILKAGAIQTYLTTEKYGQEIVHYEVCESTQTIAHQLAQEGAQEGTIVIAEEQTAGRGRRSRPWASEAKAGIWFSIILRPLLTPQEAPQLTLVAAIAVTRAIEKITGVAVQIKWPNDLCIGTKKVTGILTEMQADPDRVKAIIIGIGLNVNQQHFPSELETVATSLALHTNQTFSRAQLVAEILNQLEHFIALYEQHGFAPLKLLWESYSNMIGRRVHAALLHQEFEGIVIGISEKGLLQLRDDEGNEYEIYSADLTYI